MLDLPIHFCILVLLCTPLSNLIIENADLFFPNPSPLIFFYRSVFTSPPPFSRAERSPLQLRISWKHHVKNTFTTSKTKGKLSQTVQLMPARHCKGVITTFELNSLNESETNISITCPFFNSSNRLLLLLPSHVLLLNNK